MSDSLTPSDRFEHITPLKPVMWHAKASILQYAYRYLHSEKSAKQRGTLKYFKEKFNRKNANPEKVLNSYEGSEELFLNVGRAYIIAAFMEFCGMEDFSSTPTKNSFPTNPHTATKDEKQSYFDDLVGRFVDCYVLQKAPYVTVEEDHKKNYGMYIIFLTVLILQLKDTAKEGDGDRNLINQKLMLSVFKSCNSYAKYSKEMFVAISQVECLLTPQLSEQFKWTYFVNWRGGEGKNMEEDLCHEITNKVAKGMIQMLGPNKTLPSIGKVTKAASGVKTIIDNFDTAMKVGKHSVQHQKLDAIKEEKLMVKDLLKVKPFVHQTGRKHASFPDIQRTPFKNLDNAEFSKWLLKCRDELPVHK